MWKCHRWRHVVGAMAAVAPADDDTVPIEPGTVSKALKSMLVRRGLEELVGLLLSLIHI